MKKILWTVCFLTVVFTACKEEDWSPIEENGTLVINFTIQNPSSGPITRSTIAPEAGEENIKTLDLIFFDSNSDGTGTFKGWKKLTATPEKPLTMNTDMIFDFSDIGLNMTDAYDILVVANMGDNYLPIDGSQTIEEWKAAVENKNFKEAKADVQVFIKGTNSDSPEYTTKPLESEALLMSTSLRKESQDTKINIILQRGVSRFDIHNSSIGYTLESASIWNAYPSLFVWNGEPNAFDIKVKRITRLYGIKSDAGNDIVGELYAFENYVASPKQNDEATTCLIIGVRNNDSGTVSYHRANVHPPQSGQSLKRNNVYRLTINSIKKEGYKTELEAYKGENSTLNYSINYWDMDSHGTVQFDGDNILAVPTKKVMFTPNGGSYNLGIFTFGEGSLSLSKKVLDNGLSVSLDNKTLSVSATPLNDAKDTRNGIIELSFGNLKATIDIEQLEGGDLYLDLNPKSIPHFSNKAGIAAPSIAVESSGDWSATIYPPGAGAYFSFEQTGSSAITDYDSNKSPNNTIPVYTHTANTTTSPRYGFLVVSLKEDPSVQSMMLLIQNGEPGFELTPSINSIEFEYDGELTISGNNINTFLVNPGLTDDGTSVNSWKYILEGDNADAFVVKDIHDDTNLKLNRLTITAKQENASSKTLSAKLYLELVNDSSVKSQVITISQKPMSFSTGIVGDMLYVSENQDETLTIHLQGSNNMKWIAELEQPEPALAHTYNVKMVAENGSEMSWGNEYTMDTKFKIQFPKTLYKDANRDITYHIKLTLSGTDISSRIAVVRSILKPITVKAANLYGGYGALGNGILSIFRDYGGYSPFFGPQGLVYMPATPILPNNESTSAGVGANIPDNINILFSGRYEASISNYYDNLIAWLENSPDKNRFAVISLDNSNTENQALLSKFSKWGYKYRGNTGPNATWTTTHTNDPVWNYIVKNGPFSNYRPSQQIDFSATFYRDGISGTFDVPSNVTNVLNVSGYGCSLYVDLQRRIIIIGDSQHTNTWTPTCNNLATVTDNAYYGRGILWATLWAIIYNTAQYGDHFTDAFQ